MLRAWRVPHREVNVGDKSPKSKQKNKDQKSASKQGKAAKASAKQESQKSVPGPSAKGKK